MEHYNAPPPELFSARYNIAPTTPVLAYHQGRFDFFRWGLIPAWAKDISIGNRMFNARAETVEQVSDVSVQSDASDSAAHEQVAARQVEAAGELRARAVRARDPLGFGRSFQVSDAEVGADLEVGCKGVGSSDRRAVPTRGPVARELLDFGARVDLVKLAEVGGELPLQRVLQREDRTVPRLHLGVQARARREAVGPGHQQGVE